MVVRRMPEEMAPATDGTRLAARSRRTIVRGEETVYPTTVRSPQRELHFRKKTHDTTALMRGGWFAQVLPAPFRHMGPLRCSKLHCGAAIASCAEPS